MIAWICLIVLLVLTGALIIDIVGACATGIALILLGVGAALVSPIIALEEL